MTNDNTDIVLQARQTPTAANHPAAPVPLSMSEKMEMAHAIAAAGEMVPRAYQGKPGAVLLAMLWAESNNVDVFTAIQNISVIDGKPYVSALMRVELATAKGFEFRTIESTYETCTIEVWRHGYQPTPQLLGSVTANIGDKTRKLKHKSGAPTNWATDADDMLLAEASRKADRRHVRTAASLIDASHDHNNETAADPVTVLTPAPDKAALDQIFDDTPETPDEPLPANETPSVDELKAAIKASTMSQGDLLRHMQTTFTEANLLSLEAIAAHPEASTQALNTLQTRPRGRVSGAS